MVDSDQRLRERNCRNKIGDNMRIHSDKLTYRDLLDGAALAGVDLVDCDSVGSRSRAKAFKLGLTGTSCYRTNFGGDHQAATWDEWGMFLAHLYEVDPEFHCGARSYKNAEHFHWMTGNRFRTLTKDLQHKRHQWNPQGRAATGAYAVSRCKCGAIQRWELEPGWFESLRADHPAQSV